MKKWPDATRLLRDRLGHNIVFFDLNNRPKAADRHGRWKRKCPILVKDYSLYV